MAFPVTRIQESSMRLCTKCPNESGNEECLSTRVVDPCTPPSSAASKWTGWRRNANSQNLALRKSCLSISSSAANPSNFALFLQYEVGDLLILRNGLVNSQLGHDVPVWVTQKLNKSDCFFLSTKVKPVPERSGPR
ncbi:hypothetical protein IAQ61_004172 [Plenodomus lingam]|uniref:uncharacterized protein n=1 Tax=Leptosphaeria maculans TaxID=5022 RepID=UPI0033170E05|nr:hypothetical protein IAQ61_004172 [Plenodomus lingam]